MSCVKSARLRKLLIGDLKQLGKKQIVTSIFRIGRPRGNNDGTTIAPVGVKIAFSCPARRLRKRVALRFQP